MTAITSNQLPLRYLPSMRQRPMRIVHVINTLVQAGAELFVLRLARAQVAKGHRVVILVLQHAENHLVAEAEKNGIQMQVENLPRRSLRCMFAVRHYLSKETSDVVHAHLGPAQYWVAAAKATLSCSAVLVSTEHSTFNSRRAWRLMKPVELIVYGRYDAIACISEATRLSLMTWLPSLVARMRVVENGIDLDAIQGAPYVDPAELFKLKHPLILCVGRLSQEKGQDVLIKALAHLPGYSLLFIGAGPMLDEWKKIAAACGVVDRIVFGGTSRQVYSLMKGCDIYVQPSRWEGFGIAALEALACGARVVAADVPGLREVVGQHGLLFRSEDVDHLGDVIRQSGAQLPPSQADFTEAYAIDQVADRYSALYSELLKKEN